MGEQSQYYVSEVVKVVSEVWMVLGKSLLQMVTVDVAYRYGTAQHSIHRGS